MAMFWVNHDKGQVQASPKSDPGSRAGTRVPPTAQDKVSKMSADLMDDFPPSPDRLVTLANWRKAPFSAWGFRNVRRLIPTANIAASNHAAGLEMSLEDIGHIGFTGHDGNPTTISRALRTTDTDAFVVLRRGRLAMEWCGNGMSATTPHIVFP